MQKQRPRMTIQDVCRDLRSRGMGLNHKTVTDGIESGLFPFGRLLATNPSGRRTFLILRKDYEAWADENVGPVLFEEEAV